MTGAVNLSSQPSPSRSFPVNSSFSGPFDDDDGNNIIGVGEVRAGAFPLALHTAAAVRSLHHHSCRTRGHRWALIFVPRRRPARCRRPGPTARGRRRWSARWRPGPGPSSGRRQPIQITHERAFHTDFGRNIRNRYVTSKVSMTDPPKKPAFCRTTALKWAASAPTNTQPVASWVFLGFIYFQN